MSIALLIGSNFNKKMIGTYIEKFFFTDKGYFNLLKNYVGNQASMGGKDSSYLLIRNDVHNQLVKMMQKK